MQPVNNDMDELFRRASENYPLNTQSADWNKVMQGLASGRSEPVPQRIRSLERYFWMAAIFLILVCTTFIQKAEYRIPADRQSSNALDKTSIEATNQEVESVSPPVESNVSVLVDSKNIMVHHKRPDKVYSYPTRTTSPFLMPPKQTSSQQVIESMTRRLNEQLKEVEIKKATNRGELTVTVDSTQLLVKERLETVTELHGVLNSRRKRLIQNIYAGLMVGPDVSTVRSQKISSPGYSVGLLVGYQFNKKLSLESGVLWDRKDYYSTGKHFNKEGLGIPQHARILDVDGYCNMFEIPVNIKFNWAKKSRHNLFATAGVSSYLMKNEEYDYSYDYYGTQYNYYKQYKNASRNWTSILNLSIGFEKKMGNAGSLRIEPYMKLPLKGVGVGDLPIGSKGVFVGFTRPLR